MIWREITGFPSAAAVQGRLEGILAAWDGTPYQAGQQMKGAGADCVRFVFGVLDELYGFRRAELPELPSDIAMHKPKTAIRAMRQLLRLYPNDPVEDGITEPGDVVVVAPPGGGPGHALITGARRNTLWHSTGRGVQMTGIGILWARYHPWKLSGVYRPKDREKWSSNS